MLMGFTGMIRGRRQQREGQSTEMCAVPLYTCTRLCVFMYRLTAPSANWGCPPGRNKQLDAACFFKPTPNNGGNLVLDEAEGKQK